MVGQKGHGKGAGSLIWGKPSRTKVSVGGGGEARAGPTLKGPSAVGSLRGSIFPLWFIRLDLGCHFLNGDWVLKPSSGGLWGLILALLWETEALATSSPRQGKTHLHLSAKPAAHPFKPTLFSIEPWRGGLWRWLIQFSGPFPS